MNLKKKLAADKEKLGKELDDFEQLKTSEKKKIEEEKKRLKRDKMLLEKNKKPSSADCKSCEEGRKLLEKTNKELKAKESLWSEEQSKLKEQLRKQTKKIQDLENENRKIKLKTVSGKLKPVLKESTELKPEILVKRHSTEVWPAVKESDAHIALSKNMKEENSRTESNVVREEVFEDGHKEVWYVNGNRKEMSADGNLVKTFFFNGDVEERSEGLVRYLYSESQTWCTKHSDGTEITQFSNGQQVTVAFCGINHL